MRYDRYGFTSHDFNEASSGSSLPDIAKSPEAQLFRAIDRKDIAVVKKLLGINETLRDKFKNAFAITANIECKNEDDFTPLHRACMGGSLEIVRLLLNHGAKIDSVNGHQGTALSLAAINGHKDIVDELLQRGFDMHAVELPAHANALCQAISHGRKDIALHLLAKGADPLRAGPDGVSGLTAAASTDNVALVEKILDTGLDIDCIDAGSQTALMRAVRHNRIDVVNFLIERGAKIDMCNKAGHTALYFAATAGNAELSTLLIERGANPHARNAGLVTLSPFEKALNGASSGKLKPVFENWHVIRQRYLDRLDAEAKRADDIHAAQREEIIQVVGEGTADKMKAVRSISFKK